MAYALASLFDEAVQDQGKYTIFRPENTLEPVDFRLLKQMHQASGLDVPDLIRLKPERLVSQWVAALVPFGFKIDDDAHFLKIAEKVREFSVENIDIVHEELTPYYAKTLSDVARAVEHEFDEGPGPDEPNEVNDAVHQIRRLIALRQDLGMCEFDEADTRRLTHELAVSFFYNREANSIVQRHVDSAIDSLIIMGEPGLEEIPDPRNKLHKHIHVSGGQGAGKTQLSRRTLGFLNENEQNYIRVNKDIFRPLVLDPDTMNGEGDLSDPDHRKLYGRITEDELNMIKRKQWSTIVSLAESDNLPNVFVDSTSIIHPHHVAALTEKGSSLSLLYVHTPFDEAQRRIAERALGDGIPGIDTLRESLETEMIQGHRESAREVASLLIHGAGKNIKVKILDGRSADRTKPVEARVELDKGKMEIRNVRAILEIFHKSTDGKTALAPSDEDLAAQIPNFDKIASVMREITFLDPESGRPIAKYDNGAGMQIIEAALVEDEFLGTLTGDVMTRLDQFYNTHKAALLRIIAEKKGHVFEHRRPFGADEPFKIVTDNFETEVPLVERSLYIDDSAKERLLEWRHLAKRGKFLDGQFDPWRKTAPDEIRMLAARSVTDAWLTDAVVEKIADDVAQKLGADGAKAPVTVHIANPVKDHTRPGVNINFMVMAYTEELTKRLNTAMKARHPDLQIGFAADRPLMALASDRATRTTAGTLERLTSQPFYDYGVFEEGEHVIFADEHVQAGGVMLAARNVMNSVNLDILGYTALSSHNLGAELRINPDIRMALDTAIEENARMNGGDAETYKLHLDEALDQVGLSRETITNLEGLILIAYLLDGKEDSRRSWFETLKRSAGLEDKDVREGMDSLDDLLAADPVTPAELGAMMKDQIERSRKAVYPSMTLT